MTKHPESPRRNPASCARLFLVGTCLMLHALTGCITGDGALATRDEADVVERSQPRLADWIDLAPHRWHTAAGGHRFILHRDRMQDLPLGLKQSQLAAMSESREALAQQVSQRVREDLGDLGPAAGAELDRHVAEVVQDVHGRYARVVDLYYEKRRDQTYTVLALVEMSKAAHESIRADLERRLGRAADPTLRRSQGSGLPLVF